MRKTWMTLAAVMLLTTLGAASAWATDVLGVWKIIDDKTNKPTAYVYLYMFDGKLYGRMVATIDEDTGLVDDTLATKKHVADELAGDPPMCGLDFVYGMQLKGKDWKGSIIDPKDGKVYDCTIKRDGNKLIVRGSLRGTGGLLGRNQTWLLAGPSELPKDFTLPNPSSFVPVIPTKKKK
ncbi:MAG: DUF2147 domain-containing protein [Spirochaetales bacterium]|nr:DUF2147 domain-containing protein [Spirochaetales bacterium]MBP7263412.1 DUF2147 domain-containing protein [Spirochaetia bacterium]